MVVRVFVVGKVDPFHLFFSIYHSNRTFHRKQILLELRADFNGHCGHQMVLDLKHIDFGLMELHLHASPPFGGCRHGFGRGEGVKRVIRVSQETLVGIDADDGLDLGVFVPKLFQVLKHFDRLSYFLLLRC